MSIENQVAAALASQPGATKIVVALSGGIDSVVLLDAVLSLKSLTIPVIAVHVHHGLSEKADSWLMFCSDLCARYNIYFCGERVSIPDFSQGVEAAARDARYAALSKHLDEHTVLLTAQHQDDQAETLLLALKRGSGVRGLAAMPSVLVLGQGRLLRPLLSTSRADIEAYARLKGLEWVEDDSNRDNQFDRNFFRLDVLPALNQRWPGFSANVARSAQLAGQANELLDEIANEDLTQVRIARNQLNLTTLIALSDARVNNLLRLWLRQFDIEMPSQLQLAQLVRQMCHAKVDSDPIIDLGQFSVRRYQQAIYLVAKDIECVASRLDWDVCEPLFLGNGLGAIEANASNELPALRQPLESEIVSVHFSVAGSIKVAPHGRDKRRTIKKLLQEYNVPTWQRQYVPFIYYNQQLVCAVGLWIDKGFLASTLAEAINIELC